ncbi:unnamed protein product [Vitrella brassicaformis CCMP3155]|uniref:GP-PDE domain-containing protein n=1 Tax=Vitrella brassicaformis (strain CCMP3155) TaxID=1169540 RepID=A0A0G4E9K1_VITBC|nr:unnamed protein product [Vitrella brassicaformis CCMP3155]|eukprot:CEL92287.1 unnamed protein product [Vitrella brassicaformis CCMP3155]
MSAVPMLLVVLLELSAGPCVDGEILKSNRRGLSRLQLREASHPAAGPCAMPAAVTGHRGSGCSVPGCPSKAGVPEKSMAAFVEAAMLGIDEVELDVWLTKDNKLLVFHGGESYDGGVLSETVVAPRTVKVEESTYDEMDKAGHLYLRVPWVESVRKLPHKAGVPEKSMAAFVEAAMLGIDEVELDVWLTKDNRLLVFHGGESYDGGVLSETVVAPRTVKVEESTYDEMDKAGHLYLRVPWVESVRKLPQYCDKAVELPVADYAKASATEKQTFSEAYEKDTTVATYKGEKLKVPLLEDVFHTFCRPECPLRLAFNVEIKGSKPQATTEVLKLAEKYGGRECVRKISSFSWLPPDNAQTLCNDQKWKSKTELTQAEVEQCPNGFVPADLLANAKNGMGIEIGVLFNRGPAKAHLPSSDRMVAILHHFSANWAHVTYKAQFESWDRTVALHKANKKVLAWYGGHAEDSLETFEEQAAHGVDALCCNQIEDAILEFCHLNQTASHGQQQQHEMLIPVPVSAPGVLVMGM